MKIAAASWVNGAEPLLQQQPALAQRQIGLGLQLDPTLAAAYFNLGLALHQRGRIPAAVRAYRLALQLAEGPGGDAGVQAAAQRNLAQDLLLSGAFRDGWAAYGQRPTAPDLNLVSAEAGEPWQGIWDPRPLERLLLVAEQGLGDTLMFCRLGLWMQRQLGLSVSLLCQAPLVELLRDGTGLSQVDHRLDATALGQRGSRWCPLLSLPQRMNLRPNRMGPQPPYLQIDAPRVALWRRRLQRRAGFRLIALHWQGNPRHEGSLYSRGRSLPFTALRPLGQLPGVEFVSVQKGAGSEQLAGNTALRLVRGQPLVGASMDFRDTAAVLANCDLLISADSGVVHLAGALGLRAWVGLCQVPEWRWGLVGERTPWYPSLRLFRQTAAGDWDGVIQAMVRAWLLSR